MGPVRSAEVGCDYQRSEEQYGQSTLCGEYNYEEIYAQSVQMASVCGHVKVQVELKMENR